MLIKNPGFKHGSKSVTRMNDLDWKDPKNSKMDFTIIQMEPEGSITFNEKLEKAILLMYGEITLKWEDNSYSVKRNSYFDDNPTALLVPSLIKVEISSGKIGSEICFIQTKNDLQYKPRLFTAKECLTEQFGKGTLRETSTRDVRTIFDKNNMPESNLVLGEVINYPGKWSSYPPHGHSQPEIYYYRFLPEQGFGMSMDGMDAAHIVKNGDAVLVLDGVAHSQTAAPGYAMYYIWAIRHLDGDPYGPEDPRKFIPEHTWVMDPQNNAKIWPPKE